mmetsp:Transcript_102/g.361  ORF Transcript_102/g.361 Transcript_102/m.361 type:complete len:464 (+) Transcript_102:76-1467(+)
MPKYISEVKSWAVGDVVAGVTVAATSLPQYIAYAELAGLSGHRGLTTSAPPIVAFAFLTGSPCLCIGVTSITALMAHASLRGAEYKEANGEEAWVDLLSAFSVLVGLASVVLALSGAARLASQIPAAVKAGWKLGFAMTVVAAQMAGAVFSGGAKTPKTQCVLPKMSDGSPLSGGAAAMYRLGWTLASPLKWDPFATALALLTLFLVLRAKGVLQKVLRLPGIEVIVATAVGTLIAVSLDYKGDIVGVAPHAPNADSKAAGDAFAMLTSWVRRWPWELPLSEMADRLGGWPWAIVSAVAFAGVDFLAIISVEAEKPPPGGWSPARELTGQGVGCVVSGMSGSAPVGGSLSRSMVAGMTGASSPIMGLVAGLTTFVLAFPQVAAILAPTPKAVLAAIVLAAVLPGVVQPKDVLKLKGADALVGWATAVASCFTDPTKGFGIGLVLHLVIRGIQSALGGSAKKAD